MIPQTHRNTLALFAILACAAMSRAADDTSRYQAVPRGSIMLLQGTSTLHDWEMKGTIIGGYVEFPSDAKFDTNQNTLPGLKDGKLAVAVQAVIPASSIRSEADVRPEYMEGLMQEALKATNFASIEYHASELKLQTPRAAGAPFLFDAHGELAIAGVTNKVYFPVSIESVDADKIKIHGEAKVKMSDYGVTPPAPNFGLGLMKCGDEVKIIFDWTLRLKKPAAGSP